MTDMGKQKFIGRNPVRAMTNRYEKFARTHGMGRENFQERGADERKQRLVERMRENLTKDWTDHGENA